MISSEQGFLFEMHLHTAGVSTCAHVPAEKSMRLYKRAGYAGVVVTDHINSLSLIHILLKKPMEQKGEKV